VGLINGASGLGRIVLGFSSDLFGQLNTLWFCLSLAASLIWPLSTTFGPLVFFGLLYGFFVGGFISLLPTCIVHLFGKKDIGTITGMVYTRFFFGNLCGPPLSGLMLDSSTTNDPTTGAQILPFSMVIDSFILLSTKIHISQGVFFTKI